MGPDNANSSTAEMKVISNAVLRFISLIVIVNSAGRAAFIFVLLFWQFYSR